MAKNCVFPMCFSAIVLSHSTVLMHYRCSVSVKWTMECMNGCMDECIYASIDGQHLRSPLTSWLSNVMTYPQFSLLQTFCTITFSTSFSASCLFLKYIFSFGFQNKMLFWHNHNTTKYLILRPLLVLISSPGFHCGHPKAQTLGSFFIFCLVLPE